MCKATIFASLVLANAACRMDARQQAPPPDAAAARTLAVDFYAWYHPNDSTSHNMDDALKQRRSSFTPDLAGLIEADRACSARAHAICNLDSDPFLNSQDPCERYEVGGTAVHHDTIGVSVFAVCGGRRDTIPSIIAMVVWDNSGWKFTNFVYPTTDLRATLSQKAGQ